MLKVTQEVVRRNFLRRSHTVSYVVSTFSDLVSYPRRSPVHKYILHSEMGSENRRPGKVGGRVENQGKGVSIIN